MKRPARETKICNCAGCGHELESLWVDGVCVQSGVKGRIKGRPYCTFCLDSHKPPAGHYGPYKDDTSPGWENAVRALED